MKFVETSIRGAFVVELEEHTDDRGLFARTYCRDEFAAHGLDPEIAQCNLSFNHRAGTLRGMHYQAEPALETKLVRCTRGAIYDVIVDMRPDSATYLQHFGVELDADARNALYIPGLCAHGYQALTDGTEVAYQVGTTYTPECERGFRHDDPALGIRWPQPVTVISDKDASWPLLEGAS